MTRSILSAVCLSLLAACAKDAPEKASPVQAAAQAAQAAPAAEAAKPEKPSDPHAGLDVLEVEDVQKLIAEKKVVPVDSNGAETRKEHGVLPGAVLLSNARTYDISELPEDKSTELVFYCGSQRCTAAPKAARRAKEAGYTAVKVMPAGIRGWVEAGKPVEQS